ncbi:hypothetical protein AB0I81_53865 [Nonomuraea sp. NPDC050404]|uniref:hypothetical protein n=1 Tax=Nonomuraea sp. NPDC050404 TaxID=3155783 RepID=UPI0034051786
MEGRLGTDLALAPRGPDDKQDYYYTNGGHKTRRVAVWHAFGIPDAACVQLHIWSHYDGTSTPTGSSSNC